METTILDNLWAIFHIYQSITVLEGPQAWGQDIATIEFQTVLE